MFVDNFTAKATGISSILILDATDTNTIWAIIGVTYSIIMGVILFLTIRELVNRTNG